MYRAWRRRKAILHKNCLFLYFKDSLSYTQIYKLVCLMDRKCRFIQTQLKKCSLYKKTLFKKLRSAWDISETEKIFKKKGRLPEKHLKPEPFPINKSQIPDEIKDILIRKFIKDKFKAYNKVLNDYFKACKELDKETESNKWKIDCINVKLTYPTRPNFPLFLHIFSTKDFISLKKSALSSKSLWDTWLDSEKQKILKSYH